MARLKQEMAQRAKARPGASCSKSLYRSLTRSSRGGKKAVLLEKEKFRDQLPLDFHLIET